MKGLLLPFFLVVWTFFPQPPTEFQKPRASAIVYFAPRADVERLCSKADDRVIACAVQETHLIIAPNPCEWPIQGDAYAELVCHEMGHINGWRH